MLRAGLMNVRVYLLSKYSVHMMVVMMTMTPEAWT